MDKIRNISCPNCSHEFDVEQVLAGRMEEQYKIKMEVFRKDLLQQYIGKQELLDKEKSAFEEKKKRENELFKDRLEKELLHKEKDVKEKIKEEYELQMKAQSAELEEKSKQVRALKEKEIELVKMQRKMQEQEKEIELKFQLKLNNQLKESEEAIQKRLKEGMDMKLLEKDKQLDDQKKLIEEMKRKADQGSMQMQGEVMELAIEEMLRRSFPHDEITEVMKGQSGADSIQTVINKMMQPCGKIIYEAKRTKAFSEKWIQKLRQDQIEAGADIAVLVSDVFPREMTTFGEYNGVWICNYTELTSIVYVLRQILIKSFMAREAHENKGEKIEILYNFLISEEFKNQISSIIDGFSRMKDDLETEKRAMKRIWKTREKQIEIVVDNTINMYGSIKGIAGNAIPTIDKLELPGVDDEIPELY